MTKWPSTVRKNSHWAAKYLRRGIVACVFAGLVAIAAPAQDVQEGQNVTVTLLPAKASTAPPGVAGGDLSVTDKDAKHEGNLYERESSWLYFSASALPARNEIEITEARLRLVRKEGLDRKMTIIVKSAAASSPDGAPPANYEGGEEVGNIESFRAESVGGVAPKPGSDYDYATLSPKFQEAALLKAGHIGLLLVPSDTTASRRVYYGLRSDKSEAGWQPRLMITYHYISKPDFGCTSEPSKLADLQSEGLPARISGCDFITKENNPRQDKYTPYPIATDSLTVAPVVYGNLALVVRNNDGSACPDPKKPNAPPQRATCLEARGPLGQVVWRAWVDDGENKVLQGDRMVVNRFGCLRIVAKDAQAIYTFQLKGGETPPDRRLVQRISFEAKVADVVDGPDGTLYFASGGVFALNPDDCLPEKEVEFSKQKDCSPRKLWYTSLGTSASNAAKITLGPDGSFVYVLANLSGAGSDRSDLLAINSQTGRNVSLTSEKVEPVFPKLDALYYPVVAKHQDGADYVYIAGNGPNGGVLWSVMNEPREEKEGGDSLARLTREWSYDSGKNLGADCSVCVFGQPILGSIPSKPSDLSEKNLYFLVSGTSKSELRAVGARDDKTVQASNGGKLPLTCTVDKILSPTSLTCKESLPQLSDVSAYYSIYNESAIKTVNTSGAVVKGVMTLSAPPIDYTEVGQHIKIGSGLCTVIAKTQVCIDPYINYIGSPGSAPPRQCYTGEDEYSLTCKEDLGEQSNAKADVPWARVNTSGHVVTLVDTYLNPHRDPMRTSSGVAFSGYNGWPPGPTMRIGDPETVLPANISTDGNPVVDSAGNVMFWANGTFYGFTRERKPLFDLKLPGLGNPQLLFGPGGTLYAASGGTVNALIPSFNLDALGNDRKIKSPTNLQVTGTATGGAPWELEARGSVILGNGFQVQSGATLSVKVPGETPSVAANVNASISRTVVTWISGPKFDKTVVGQVISIGGNRCTVATKTSDTSLTCEEDLGAQPGGTAYSNSPGVVVNTAGNLVKMPYNQLHDLSSGPGGILVGSRPCTVQDSNIYNGQTAELKCKEDQGNYSGILAYRADGNVSTSPARPTTPNPNNLSK